MKRTQLPEEVLQALAAAAATPGWNNRPRTIRCFDLGDCRLYVVPFRVWARRRQEKQAAAWHAVQAEGLQA